MTGIDRTSIREPQSVARLSRTFSKSLSAVDLAEPLISLDENQSADLAAAVLRARGASVLGVRRAGMVTGWVGLDQLGGGTLGGQMRPFAPEELLDETTGLDVVLDRLSVREHAFIQWLGEPSGVITRRDLQKPPLRMWLFGAITILDANMTWTIEMLYPGDGWQDRVSAGRLEKAASLRAIRQRSGAECRLVDCLQIKDKADILVGDNASFERLGVSSRREAERLARDIEGLRNHLAHAQELESTHLATAARLASAIGSILRAEVAQDIIERRCQASPATPE
jgi:hypothetical protein